MHKGGHPNHQESLPPGTSPIWAQPEVPGAFADSPIHRLGTAAVSDCHEDEPKSSAELALGQIAVSLPSEVSEGSGATTNVAAGVPGGEARVGVCTRHC
jgi:hypothetical protein